MNDERPGRSEAVSPTARLQDDLVRKLTWALQLYENENATPDMKRLAILAQLATLERLANSLLPLKEPEYWHLLKPLRDLEEAFCDLGSGKVDSLLAPHKVGHNPQLDTEEAVFRAIAAAAMELYMRAGERKAAAARIVAEQVGERIGRRVEGMTIAKWREDVDKNAWAFSVYRRETDLLRKTPAEPEAAAAELLSRLQDYKPLGRPE